MILLFFSKIALTPMLFGYFLVHFGGFRRIFDVRTCTPYGIFRSRGILTAVNIQKTSCFAMIFGFLCAWGVQRSDLGAVRD